MKTNQYGLTTLSENPEYYDEVIALIEKEFHYSSDQSFAKDFSLLVDPLNFENCYLYIDPNTNSVISHLAICPRVLIKNNIEMNVAFIGGIVTAQEYRGQGLFKNLLNRALTQHQETCGLFILWSEITGLYEKFNFYLSGGNIETGQAVFNYNDRPVGFQKLTFPTLSSEEFSEIKNIYENFNQKYFFTTLREEKDWSMIKEMSSIDLYVKKNEEGKIVQYFCINKGRDLTNIIHEVGCLPDNYLSLMRALEKFKTWLPESEQALFKTKDIFFTSYIRIGNASVLNNFLNKVTDQKLGIKKANGNLVEFTFDNEAHSATEQDFLQYLLGPRPLVEFKPYNLSIYIPGTDSV